MAPGGEGEGKEGEEPEGPGGGRDPERPGQRGLGGGAGWGRGGSDSCPVQEKGNRGTRDKGEGSSVPLEAKGRC